MASGVRVIRFRLWHLRRVMAIEKASFPREAYSRQMFLDLYRDCPDLFFVARRSFRIVGYIVTCLGGHGAEIVSVAVDPKHRGAGIGAALMRHTLQRLADAGLRIVSLMVRVGNLDAIRFYKGLGFRAVRRVPRYYQDGGEALRMQKRL